MVVSAKISSKKCISCIENSSLAPNAFCNVVVDGSVSRPGSYTVPVGTLLKKIVRKSKPSLFADLHFLDLEQRVSQDLVLHIEELKEIEILVRKEGKCLRFRVPVKTRFCDLKTFSELSSDFSHPAFKSRRALKPFEIIDLSLE